MTLTDIFLHAAVILAAIVIIARFVQAYGENYWAHRGESEAIDRFARGEK